MDRAAPVDLTRPECAVTRLSTPATRAAGVNRSPIICADSRTTGFVLLRRTVMSMPSLSVELATYGLLDPIAIFALGCVNPDPPAVAARPPRSVLDRLPAVEESPRPKAGER